MSEPDVMVEVRDALRDIAESMKVLAECAKRTERHTLHTARQATKVYALIRMYVTNEEE